MCVLHTYIVYIQTIYERMISEVFPLALEFVPGEQSLPGVRISAAGG